MNRKFLISVVAVFALSMGLGFVVHGLLLGPEYGALSNLFRSETEAQAYFPFMLLAHALMAVALVWIYRRGREEKPFFAQGLRFGLAVGLLLLPLYLIYFVVQPTPADLAARQIAFEGIALLVKGVVIAWLNR